MDPLWKTRSDIPLIDRVRIQAEVLVPLVRELRIELGEQRAHDILRRTLAPLFRSAGERFFHEAGGRTFEAMQAHGAEAVAGGAVTYALRETEGGFEADVTGCRYASFFHELGEPELGFLFVCNSDYGVYEAFPGATVERTQTIMQGASHCDFRYRLLRKPESST